MKAPRRNLRLMLQEAYFSWDHNLRRAQAATHVEHREHFTTRALRFLKRYDSLYAELAKQEPA